MPANTNGMFVTLINVVFCTFAVFSVKAEIEAYPSDHGGSTTTFHSSLSPESLQLWLRDEPIEHLHTLGKTSDVSGSLQRIFLSPAGLRAARLIDRWMQEAGLRTWMDGVGNVHGRIDGPNPSAPALLVGSHMDTVLDAGQYDGALGIICAIAAIKTFLKQFGAKSLLRPIEIIAFSDEEGVRFQSTFLGSTAITGKFPTEFLHATDKSGTSLSQALATMGLEGSTKSGMAAQKYDPKKVWGYIEAHIEQGPVLEAEGMPLGIVPAISGQTRLSVRVEGEQGHAGTVPMRLRKDPMAAAAESVVGIERICMELGAPVEPFVIEADVSGLVCTVGELNVWPGASNVIPGQVTFSVDIRARKDPVRKEAVSQIQKRIDDICLKRGLNCAVEQKHDASALECSPNLINSLTEVAKEAISKLHPFASVPTADINVPLIVSGAGHDAMAMGQLTQVGMFFVRCRGGISHSPEEYVDDSDVFMASTALMLFIQKEASIFSSSKLPL